MSEAAGGLAFPCKFPIKVMGSAADAHFEGRVVETVQRHVADFDAVSLSKRASRQGTYLALTVTLEAQSQAQLDALYRDLSELHGVVMVL